MPKKTIKKPAKKITKRWNWPFFGLRLSLVFCLIISLLLSIYWFVHTTSTLKVNGTAKINEKQIKPLSSKPNYHNLDLRVAKLLVYKGSSLKVIHDLGVIGGVKQQVISFPVYSDGLTEYGLMTLPAAPAPGNGYPVVVLCHGYTNPAHYSTSQAYLSQMEFYSQHGFAVVKPDYRGQGLSIKEGKPEGAYFSMAYNIDVLSLIASIKDTGYLDKNNISIWGHSMGAYISLRAAVLDPDIKNVILLAGPVGGLEQMYSTYVPPSDKSNPVAQLTKNLAFAHYGTPTANPSFWSNASPIDFLNQTNAYIQIHVGSNDKVVPPKFSAQLDTALTKAHKKHDYYVYQGGTHSLGPQMPIIFQRSLFVLQGS